MWLEFRTPWSRVASIVTHAEFVHAWELKKYAVSGSAERETEDASYAVSLLMDWPDEPSIGIRRPEAAAFVYLDADFAVDEVELYTHRQSTAAMLAERWPIDYEPGIDDGRWQAVLAECEEETIDRLAASYGVIRDFVIPTLKALSLLAHGIATLEDRPASRNKHARRNSHRNTPVKTMRLHAPPGQTESERHQSLHWRAEHWAPADRGAAGRFVAKGTGEDEMIWHPGRWVGDPAIGAT